MAASDRVALILMDYPNRRRLKLLGHAKVMDAESNPDPLGLFDPPGDANSARLVVIALEGFDWNCPQYITPRFTEAEIAPLRAKLAALEVKVAALTADQT